MRVVSAGARDPLVEIAGDRGIDFPDLPVSFDQPALEIGNDQHAGRNDEQRPRGETHIDCQHHDDDKKDIGSFPDKVHQPPCHKLADFAGIAHDPGMDIADIVLVEIRE